MLIYTRDDKHISNWTTSEDLTKRTTYLFNLLFISIFSLNYSNPCIRRSNPCVRFMKPRSYHSVWTDVPLNLHDKAFIDKIILSIILFLIWLPPEKRLSVDVKFLFLFLGVCVWCVCGGGSREVFIHWTVFNIGSEMTVPVFIPLRVWRQRIFLYVFPPIQMISLTQHTQINCFH